MPLRPVRAAACAALLASAACAPDLPTNATNVPAGPLASVLAETSAGVVPGAYATGINQAGVMVGTNWRGGFARGVVWRPAGGADTLRGLPGSLPMDLATSINDAGRIAGMATDSVYRQRAVVWASATAAPAVLPDPGAGGQATDINRGGMTAGWVRLWDFVPHAAVWTAEGVLTDLDPAGTGSRALAVNDSGVVVGVIRPGRNRAFRWTRETGMQLLPVGGDSSVAQDVNTRGEVVGTRWTGGQQRAYVWSPRTGLRDLGTLGASRAMGVALNDAGTVVAMTGTGDGRAAVVWTPRSGARVLDAGPYGGPVVPVGINRRGQVAGSRTGADGEPEMVLWTVTEVNPDPA